MKRERALKKIVNGCLLASRNLNLLSNGAQSSDFRKTKSLPNGNCFLLREEDFGGQRHGVVVVRQMEGSREQLSVTH